MFSIALLFHFFLQEFRFFILWCGVAATGVAGLLLCCRTKSYRSRHAWIPKKELTTRPQRQTPKTEPNMGQQEYIHWEKNTRTKYFAKVNERMNDCKELTEHFYFYFLLFHSFSYHSLQVIFSRVFIDCDVGRTVRRSWSKKNSWFRSVCSKNKDSKKQNRKKNIHIKNNIIYKNIHRIKRDHWRGQQNVLL